jgi:hypothetical protein
VLHTRDRAVANSEAFVEPLRGARGVWLMPTSTRGSTKSCWPSSIGVA